MPVALEEIQASLVQSGTRDAIRRNIGTLLGEIDWIDAITVEQPRREDTRLAYVAGIFDGEGCVSFGRVRHDRFIRTFVTNTDRETLEWLQSGFGGDINKLALRKEGWKQGYQWRLSWSRAIQFLEAIEPWVRIKRRQIEIAFAWDAIRPGQGQKTDVEAIDLLARELAWWNRKGGPQGPNPVSEVLAEMGHAS